MPIDHSAPTSLKDQLIAELMTRLSSGEFAIGQKFPSLRALADQYDVAEGTITPAIQELQRAGLITPSAGKGNFVTALPDASTQVGATPSDLAGEVRRLRNELEALSRRVADLESESTTTTVD